MEEGYTYKYNPDLNRQRYSCMCLDFGSWCSSRRRTAASFTRRLSDDEYSQYQDDDFEPLDYRSRGMMWRGLWQRVVNQKRRIFNSAAPAPAHTQYDSYTYAMNFDEGSAWVEPENLNRSFSARFAVPSAILQRVS